MLFGPGSRFVAVSATVGMLLCGCAHAETTSPPATPPDRVADAVRSAEVERGHDLAVPVEVRLASRSDMHLFLSRPYEPGANLARVLRIPPGAPRRVPTAARMAFYDHQSAGIYLTPKVWEAIENAPSNAAAGAAMLVTLVGTALVGAPVALAPGAPSERKRLANLAKQQAAEALLVHQLVRVLQAQRLGAFRARPTTDGRLAYAALVEGDALLAEQRVKPRTAKADAPANTADRAQMSGGVLPSALPRRAGLRLVRALHARWGWAGVDAAHFAPPQSSSEILHPGRFLGGGGPEPVALQVPGALAAAHYRFVGSDRAGEYLFARYFARAGDSARALAVAAGWRGDTVHVYEHDSGVRGSIWRSAWVDERAATAAAKAAMRARQAMHDTTRAQSFVSRDGRHLLIAHGFPQALHARILPLVVEPGTESPDWRAAAAGAAGAAGSGAGAPGSGAQRAFVGGAARPKFSAEMEHLITAVTTRQRPLQTTCDADGAPLLTLTFSDRRLEVWSQVRPLDPDPTVWLQLRPYRAPYVQHCDLRFQMGGRSLNVRNVKTQRWRGTVSAIVGLSVAEMKMLLDGDGLRGVVCDEPFALDRSKEQLSRLLERLAVYQAVAQRKPPAPTGPRPSSAVIGAAAPR